MHVQRNNSIQTRLVSASRCLYIQTFTKSPSTFHIALYYNTIGPGSTFLNDQAHYKLSVSTQTFRSISSRTNVLHLVLPDRQKKTIKSRALHTMHDPNQAIPHTITCTLVYFNIFRSDHVCGAYWNLFHRYASFPTHNSFPPVLAPTPAHPLSSPPVIYESWILPRKKVVFFLTCPLNTKQ